MSEKKASLAEALSQGSLGRRLLVLTILFVMLAEVMIFLPSAAAFRSNWLQDRVQAARLAAIAVEAAPDMKVSDEIASQLMTTAGIKAVRMQSDGVSEVILRAPRQAMPYATVDLRYPSTTQALIDTCDSLFFHQERFLRVLDNFGTESGDFIEVLVPEADLRRELFAFSVRTLIFSAVISLITAALIYTTLLFVIIRPMRHLSQAMSRFQDAPENPASVITPSGRKDEIGTAEATLHDMQTQLRQALVHKTRLAALGEAVAKINHDLRNILTSAQLVSDRMAMNEDPKVRTMGERLVRAISRGVALCQTTLQYGRAEEEKPRRRTMGLRDALEDAFMDACTGGCAIVFDNGVEAGVSLLADPDQVHRIVLNLMRNAVQAMPAKGEIAVRAETRDDKVFITLADTGPGIAPKARDALFKPFSGSTRKDGSGLGLAIARELARNHGGDVTLLRTGETGTVFELVLPAGDQE